MSESQGWEYRTVPLDPARMVEDEVSPTDRLNELGREGWELAGTAPVGGGGPTTGPGTTLLFLKRPLEE